MRTIRLLLILYASLASPAMAGPPQPEQLGKSGHWIAFRHFEEKNKPVCYIAAPPSESRGQYKKRGEVFLLIANRPAARTMNVVSHVAGYEYDNKTAIVAQIGKQNFVMIPSGDTAWTPNQETDDILTRALKKGRTVKITGKSARGTQTTDIYDLKGISKALDMIDKACAKGKKR